MKEGQHERYVPQDRGWAWIICGASFTVSILIGVSIQTMSIIFLELVEELNTTITGLSVSWTVQGLSLSFSGMVSSSILIPKFGERKVVMVCGLLYSASTLGYSRAPNVECFIVLACLKGATLGPTLISSVSLVGYYFQKRRSLAMTISNCGICVAGIVAPSIIRAVAWQYGTRGTLLILSAVDLHMIVAGMLMRPVSSYRVVTNETKEMLTKEPTETSVYQKENSLLGKLPSAEQDNSLLGKDHSADQDNKNNATARGVELPPHIFVPGQSNDGNISCQPMDRSHIDNKDQDRNMSLLNAKLCSPDLSQEPIGEQHRGSHDDKMAEILKGSHQGSVVSVSSTVEPPGVGRGVPTEPVENKACFMWPMLKSLCDPTLLRQKTLCLFFLSNIPSASHMYLVQYIPTITEIQGATKDEAARLVTIVGAVELVSRLLVGVFADTKILGPLYIIGISQICLGAVMEATGSYTLVLHYVGGAVMLGGVVMFFIARLRRLEARRKLKVKDEATDV